jgi:hypothetical protein
VDTALTKSLTSYPALCAGDALGERRPRRGFVADTPPGQKSAGIYEDGG